MSRHAKLTLSPFLSPGLPTPVKRSAKPRTVPTFERGQRFGVLTVLMQTRGRRGEAAAVCRCVCGEVKTVTAQGLHPDVICKCRSAAVRAMAKGAGR